jgi:hypothetical protein
MLKKMERDAEKRRYSLTRGGNNRSNPLNMTVTGKSAHQSQNYPQFNFNTEASVTKLNINGHGVNGGGSKTNGNNTNNSQERVVQESNSDQQFGPFFIQGQG